MEAERREKRPALKLNQLEVEPYPSDHMNAFSWWKISDNFALWSSRGI